MAMDRFQKTIWAALVLALAGIAAAYFVMEPRRTEPPVDLPVIGELKPFTLTNQLGEAVSAESLRGQVLVANIIFSRCPTQCHLLSQQMARVQKGLPPGVRLLSLTADPAFDTPQILTRYGQRYGADPARWWFLTGPKADVYHLATNSLLFSVLEHPEPAKATLEELFIHSGDYRLIDKSGRLRAIVYGEQADAERQILKLVDQLRSEEHP